MKATSSYNNCVPKRECHYCNKTPSSLIQIPGVNVSTLTETITVWIGTLLRIFLKEFRSTSCFRCTVTSTLKDKASNVLTTDSKNSVVDVYSVSYLASPVVANESTWSYLVEYFKPLMSVLRERRGNL